MIAALLWYDWPEVRASTDAFWKGLRRALDRQGIAAPERLQRHRPVAGLWHDPRLLLAQTCGYLFAGALRQSVRLVATPVYDVEGCAGTNYSSAVVVRADDPARTVGDLAGRCAAYNGRDSQSGYGALRATIATLAPGDRFFASTLETGAHARSLNAIVAGKADCAAIDALCWAFVRRYRPALADALRVIAWTPSTPAPPYVTAAGRGNEEVGRLRAALFEVLDDPGLAEIRDALFLSGAEVLEDESYDAIIEMEHRAIEAGYPEIA